MPDQLPDAPTTGFLVGCEEEIEAFSGLGVGVVAATSLDGAQPTITFQFADGTVRAAQVELPRVGVDSWTDVNWLDPQTAMSDTSFRLESAIATDGIGTGVTEAEQFIDALLSLSAKVQRNSAAGLLRPEAGAWEFADGKAIESTFTQPQAIHPDDAENALRAAFEAIGGTLDSGFDPSEQDGSKAIDGDGEYINASMRVVLPDGRAMWVTVECPTDRAF